MRDYFYYDGVDSVGPYSASQLQDLLKNFEISPDTPIYHEDSDQWIPYSEFPFQESSRQASPKIESADFGLLKSSNKKKPETLWIVRYEKQVFLTISALTLCFICVAAYLFLFTQPPLPVYKGELGPAEPWVSDSKERWPLLVLSNKAWFKGRAELNGANTFLFRHPHPNGQLYAATARNLLNETNGISPAVPLPSFNNDLIFWFLNPHRSREEKIKVEGLGQPANQSNDWLILKLGQDTNVPSVLPLRLRPVPVNVNEKVYLVGVPGGGASAQNVLPGKILSRSGTHFRFEFSPQTDLTGFHGAPIVDDYGLVVGVMTTAFPETPKTPGPSKEAGGQDALVALTMLPP